MHGKDCFSEFMEEESFIHVAKVCVCVCMCVSEEREKLAVIEAVNIMLPILMVYVEFSFPSIPAG